MCVYFLHVWEAQMAHRWLKSIVDYMFILFLRLFLLRLFSSVVTLSNNGKVKNHRGSEFLKSDSFDERDTHDNKDTIKRSPDTVWWALFATLATGSKFLSIILIVTASNTNVQNCTLVFNL